MVADSHTDFISCKQSFDADIQSPENMIVDPDEYVEQSESEKDDIAIIDPDEPRPTPADDCTINQPWGFRDTELTCIQQMKL